jgi:hypothetical protein
MNNGEIKMESINNYTGYFFKRIYVIPSFPSPRWYKAHLIRKKLHRAYEDVWVPSGDTYTRFFQRHNNGNDANSRRRSAWMEILQDAVNNSFRHILVVDDRAVFHVDFDTLIRQETSGPASAPWDMISFGGLARALTLNLCKQLLSTLYSPDIRLEDALEEIGYSSRSIYLDSLVVDPSVITPGNWHRYYFNYDPGNTTVSVCCVSRRSEYIENIFANFCRQRYPDKELIIVLNGIERRAAEMAARKFNIEKLQLVKPAQTLTLGDGLNLSAAASRGHFWCKIDDDDYYGQDYLTEAVEYMISFPYDVVGKKHVHVFFPADHKGYRTTDKEFASVGFPRHAGPTIFTTRNVVQEIPFHPLNIGEDAAFYRDLHRLDYQIISSTTENFVYVRHQDNTSEFEPHLSERWNIVDSCLYRDFVLNYKFVDKINLELVEPPAFAHYLNNIIGKSKVKLKIPHTIHQIWIGPHLAPLHWMETWSKDFLAEFTGWEYRLWTEKDYEEVGIVEDDLFLNLSYAGRSDLFRYRILYRFGGVYIDADSVYLGNGSLNEIVDQASPYGIIMCEEPYFDGHPDYIAIGVIASTPGNIILDYFYHRALSLTRKAINEGIKFEAWQKTGPVMATEVLNHVKQVPILPSYIFFPEYWNNRSYWDLSLTELKQRYPHSLMFQFGYSTVNKLG